MMSIIISVSDCARYDCCLIPSRPRENNQSFFAEKLQKPVEEAAMIAVFYRTVLAKAC